MEYNNYLKTALDLSEEASKIMLDFFKPDMKIEWKRGEGPLTEADTKINRLVIDRISKLYPDQPVLGEEENSFHKVEDAEFVWVVDPIDGTLTYSHGVANSTFLLALVQNGKPVVGVITDPFMKQTYTATLGGGAFMNGKKIHVNNSGGFKEKVFYFDARKYGGRIFEKLLNKEAFPLVYWSYAYGAKQVASGQFSGTFFEWDKPYDCAALKLIIEEAGGRTSDLEGNDQRYDRKLNGFVATNGVIHDEFLALVNEAREEYEKEKTNLVYKDII